MARVACLIRLGFAICVSASAAPLLAQGNACVNSSTEPQIFDAAITSPDSLSNGTPLGHNPARSRLGRGGIEYVSGNDLRIEVVTDRCASIRQVRVGQVDLPNDEHRPVNYQVSPPIPLASDPQRLVHRVLLFLPPQGTAEGARADDFISITVGRDQGNGTAVRNLRIARVTAVEWSGTPALVTISGGEIFNLFARSNYELFGPANSATIEVRGEQRRIYGYDPSTLQVAITGNGISFQFKFKYDAHAFCDPTVRAHGAFRLGVRENGAELFVDWVNGPGISLDFAFQCQIPRLVPLLGELTEWYIRHRVSGTPESIRARLQDAVGAFAAPGANNLTRFRETSTRSDELRLGVIVPLPSISIQVPYDIPRTLALPSRETLLFTASGLGMNDRAASGVGTVSSGPNGVPLPQAAHWPAARTVARSGPLPSPADPVGRLLIRSVPRRTIAANPVAVTTYSYTPGCTIQTPAPLLGGQPRYRFSVNDSGADAARLQAIGARGYLLRIFFFGGGGESARCPATRSNERPPAAH